MGRLELHHPRAGVEEAEFDRNAAEVTVEYDPKTTSPEQLASVVRSAGYDVKIGKGFGSYAGSSPFPKGADVKTISKKGEAVELEPHLAPGKYTVFDFYAPWCGPCKKVDTEMARILGHRQDVALRKINIDDWTTPVAKQYSKHLKELPLVMVHDQNGKRVKVISGLDLPALRAALAEKDP